MNTPATLTATIISDVTHQRSVLCPLSCPQEVLHFSATALLTRLVTTIRDKSRAGLAIHFLHTDYAEPQLVEENRTTRPYLTGIEATGGIKEYGIKIEGTWEQEVERALAEADTAA